MKCERCEKEMREIADIPPLALKALGQYDTPFMSLGTERQLITLSASLTDQELGTVDIVTSWLRYPTFLHRLPGRSINAYPVVNNIAVRARVTAGTVVTPAEFSVALKFRDVGEREHIALVSDAIIDPTTAEVTLYRPGGPLISSSVLGEAPPKFGTWVLEGTIILGTATSVVFYIYANYGIVYGAP